MILSRFHKKELYVNAVKYIINANQRERNNATMIERIKKYFRYQQYLSIKRELISEGEDVDLILTFEQTEEMRGHKHSFINRRECTDFRFTDMYLCDHHLCNLMRPKEEINK